MKNEKDDYFKNMKIGSTTQCDICKKPYPDGICRKSRSGLLVCKECDGDKGPNRDSLKGKRKEDVPKSKKVSLTLDVTITNIDDEYFDLCTKINYTPAKELGFSTFEIMSVLEHTLADFMALYEYSTEDSLSRIKKILEERKKDD